MSVFLGDQLLAGTSTNTISNAHSLLDYKWTDHVLNEMCWLRADTFSWQSGKVYKAAYEHLVTDLANATQHTETLAGVTIVYYLAEDKHKIVLDTEAIKVSNIFDTVGTAWWYILDITNKRFKLPRAMHGDIIDKYSNGASWYRLYADGWCEQGGQTADGTSITVNLLKVMANNYYNVQLTCVNKSQGDQNWVATSKTPSSFLYSNSESFAVNWEVCGKVANVNSGLTPYQYLYFYIGDYSQSAIEQTAGITTEQLNEKLDASRLQFVITLPETIEQNVIYLISDIEE